MQPLVLTVYSQQLDKLNNAINQKRLELMNLKGVVFHPDNARPHTSFVTRQKLLEIDWDVLPHPPYSPDLASSDYHLLRSLQNSLNRKTFDSDDAINRHLVQFFASKDRPFYQRGTMNLVEQWRKVIELNSQYIID